VCIKYRVWVRSRDRRRWEAKERWRRRRGDEDVGGCVRQQVADALWELSSKYDVGVWYEYRRAGTWVDQYDVLCGVVVDGVKLEQPYCRTVDECVKQILEDYRREVERLREPPQPALVRSDPVEELLKEWPELEAFGVDWLRAWAPHAGDRLVEIANVMRRYPWMAEVLRRRPVANPHPYMVEAYVAGDGSEACMSLNRLRTYCARGGAVGEARLEFSRFEVYGGKIREVYRPRGLLAFAAKAKEYMRVL